MADLRPADDETIANEDRVFIRFFASSDSAVPLEQVGQYRPNSGALLPRRKDEAISADLASLCTAQETRDRGGAAGPFNVAVISVATVRGLDLRITRDPIAEGEDGGPNPAHALIHGSRPDAAGNLTGGLKRAEAEKLARAARLALPPHPPPPANG